MIRNRTTSRRLAGAALGLAAALMMAASAASADALDRILKEQKITVGWIPYLSLTRRNLETNKVEGFMVEVLESIAKDLGIPKDNIEYVQTDWASFAVGLNGNKYDISIAPTFATIARSRAASFTKPLFYLGNSALARDGDKRFEDVKSVYDLDRPDVTIAVTQGEQSHEFVKRNFHKAKIKVVKSADITTTMLEVSSGRADLAMADAGVVHKFTLTHPGTMDVFAEHPWGVQPISWSVKPGEQRLLNFLNTSLSFLQSVGTLEEMMRKPDYEDVPFLVLPLHPRLVER